MQKMSKLFDILLYSICIIVTLLVCSKIILKEETKIPISIGYVFSGSMEPTIRTYDGYILIKANEYRKNDIITFKPKALKEKYVTHRIVDISVKGEFTTKGDNNLSTDQEFGEPLVNNSQVIGKVLSIKGKPLTIPYVGIISNKLNLIAKRYNIFMLLSIILIIYTVEYLIKYCFIHKQIKHKNLKLKNISKYLDPIFAFSFILLFINAVIIGLTVKSWIPDKISYIVVSTKGLSSPMPGEKLTKTISLENNTFVPFLTVFEYGSNTISVVPNQLKLSPKQIDEYTVTLVAPDKIGVYTEEINKKVYPDVLPQSWFDFLYDKSSMLPLIVIFLPCLSINICLFVWWHKRWIIGKSRIYEWLIPIRSALREI